MTWRHRLLARIAGWLGVAIRFDVEPVPVARGTVYPVTRWGRGK